MAAAHINLQRISEVAVPVIEGAGYELVDLEWKRDLGSWVLRLFIDKPGGPHAPGQGVTLDGCADVSRELSTALDVSEALSGADRYQLEVSSPGIDRPLRREADFRRALGRKVKVRTQRPLGEPPGRRNFAGRLTDVAGDPRALAIDVGDRICTVPISEIEKANLVFELDGEKPAKRNGSQG